MPAAGSLLRFGLSVAFARPRPPEYHWAYPASGFALPSGHTTSSAIAAGLVAWWFARALRTRRARALAYCLAGGYAAAVGLSRIYLGVHWPTDVLAGWLLALCWLSRIGSVAGCLTGRPDGGGGRRPVAQRSPVVFSYGNPGDAVLVGDWNGDGVDSLGVRRVG